MRRHRLDIYDFAESAAWEGFDPATARYDQETGLFVAEKSEQSTHSITYDPSTGRWNQGFTLNYEDSKRFLEACFNPTPPSARLIRLFESNYSEDPS